MKAARLYKAVTSGEEKNSIKISTNALAVFYMLTLALSWRLLFNSLASEKAVTIHHNWASSLKLFLSSIQKPPSLPLLSSHHLSNNLRQHSLLSLGMHTGNEQLHSIIPVQLSMLICFRQKCRLFTIIYMVICIAQIKIL